MKFVLYRNLDEMPPAVFGDPRTTEEAADMFCKITGCPLFNTVVKFLDGDYGTSPSFSIGRDGVLWRVEKVVMRGHV